MASNSHPLIEIILRVRSIFKSADSFRLTCCIIVPCALFIVVTLLIEGVQRNTKGLEKLLDIDWKLLLSFDVSFAH